MAASTSVDTVKTTGLRGPLRFVASAALGQVVTYLLVGLIASRALDYADILGRPVISAYYLPYGSVDFVVSTVFQLVRGILFGLVLLPFRVVLAGSRWGWLWLWTLFVAVGILGTPAAAPSSFEGLLYTRIPLWFHAIGLPEMLLQTLLFSVLVHRALRAETHPLGPRAHVLVGALATACIAFLGYTAVSLVFAFAAGVDLASGSDAGVLGQFAAPLILHFVAVLVARGPWWAPSHAALYVAAAAVLALYQGLVLGSTGWTYVMLAPVLPVLISLAMTRGNRRHSVRVGT